MTPLRRMGTVLGAGAVLLVFAGPLAAQDRQGAGVPDTLRLTVEEAVAMALDRGEEVRIAREQSLLAEAQIAQARAGVFPQVSGNLRYDRQLRSVFDLGQSAGEPPPDDEEPGFDFADLFGDLPFGQPNTWVASLQINQAVYTGGRLQAAMEIADRARSATGFNFSEAEARIEREVRDAYFEAVFTESLTEIAREAFDLANRQLELVESFLRQGTASEFEVLQARVERDNLEPQIVEAENARVLAELELRRLINVPPEQPLELLFLLDLLAPDVADIDREALMAAALDRPSVRAAGEQVRIREEGVQIARAERLPTVSAFGTFSFQNFPDRLFPTGLPGGGEWREDWGVGFQVAVPIFDGLRARGAIDEARSEVRVAELQRAQLREGVRQEVAAAFARFDAALARIEARRATVSQAARGLELAELRFESGMATLIEVSNARLLLQQARVNEAEALLAYLSSLTALEHATGGQVRLVDRFLTENRPSNTRQEP